MTFSLWAGILGDVEYFSIPYFWMKNQKSSLLGLKHINRYRCNLYLKLILSLLTSLVEKYPTNKYIQGSRYLACGKAAKIAMDKALTATKNMLLHPNNLYDKYMIKNLKIYAKK